MKKMIALFIFFLLFISLIIYKANTGTDIPDKDYTVEFQDPELSEELKTAIYENDYTKARELIKKIKEQYPDTLDSEMADTYLEILDKMEDDVEESYSNIDFKNYIQLIKIWTDAPNSAGGVNLHIKWKNTSDKVVKYAYFTCELYNAVDDVVSNTITGRYAFTGTVTGPINPGDIYGDYVLWENAWWNHSGKYAKITEIEIEYMDGTEIEIPQGQINTLFY